MSYSARRHPSPASSEDMTENSEHIMANDMGELSADETGVVTGGVAMAGTGVYEIVGGTGFDGYVTDTGTGIYENVGGSSKS